MLDSSESIYQGLKNAGINFVVSLPCINLAKLIKLIDNDEKIHHIPVTREEEGIGICAGAFLGKKKIAILMQNSGLGNSINALSSLTQLYRLPLIMIISHRGINGEPIIGQVPMGEITEPLLDTLKIQYFKPKTPKKAKEIIENSWHLSNSKKAPIAFLFEIKYW
ncbi:MAG: sulfopyruvate decarboxylase subunit alpha [Methanobrevibacter sp.]|jgi:sulfopyruvate decarboxylase subunit alpha|nr:sulfopyruvate decarboxylase subunit alpha [Candidatus Methanovirga basalitermitum]